MKRLSSLLLMCFAASVVAMPNAQAEHPQANQISGTPVPARLLHSTNARPLRPVPDPISYRSNRTHNVSNSRVISHGTPVAYQGSQYGGYSGYAGNGYGYPQTHAPLYPAPVPDVPVNVGGTYITSHALSPHEMLYPHQYKSLHGPFYWRNRGKWVVTPFGVRSHDRWKLEGTEVTVKYRDHYKLFSGFHPPHN